MDQDRKKASVIALLAAVMSFASVCASAFMLEQMQQNEADLKERAEWMIRSHVATEIQSADRVTRTAVKQALSAVADKPVEVPAYEQSWVHLPFPPVTREQWEATTKAMIAEGYPAESIPEFEK